MKVRDVMTKSVATIDPNATVRDAAKIMQQHNIGSIPVVDTNGLLGIITDRDIVVRNIANDIDANASVRDVMTCEVTTVTPDTDVDQTTTLMASRQIRRIPVIDNQKLVGMVSLGDIATTGRTDMEASEALCEISKPSKPLKTIVSK